MQSWVQFSKKSSKKLGVVLYTYNPCAGEVEAEGACEPAGLAEWVSSRFRERSYWDCIWTVTEWDFVSKNKVEGVGEMAQPLRTSYTASPEEPSSILCIHIRRLAITDDTSSWGIRRHLHSYAYIHIFLNKERKTLKQPGEWLRKIPNVDPPSPTTHTHTYTPQKCSKLAQMCMYLSSRQADFWKGMCQNSLY